MKSVRREDDRRREGHSSALLPQIGDLRLEMA